jgi:membrane protein YdbS with pleckstrin-like domain
MERLHPGARWQFRFSGFFVVFIIVLILASNLIRFLSSFDSLIKGVFIFLGVFLVLYILIIEIYARMSYSRFLYEFGPSTLKIERGIIWKKFSNIPYGRVQNVDIQRGLIARMFGFSTVNIHTAGYSSGSSAGSEGRLPAVAPKKSEEIRDFLMNKISKGNPGQGM